MNEQFAKDILEGLSKAPKAIPSKYFYDEIGSALFSEIMQLPEYYLTRAELEIFQTQGQKILDLLGIEKHKYFELIELGAGDGLKTIELLKILRWENYHFDFFPIDISQKALDQLGENLMQSIPDLHIIKQKGDYFEILNNLKDAHHPKVVMFLGSNMGNMNDAQANEFLKNLSKNLSVGDKILLGLDMIKSESVVLPAYNDKKGVTRAFNLNLLNRINQELDANFNLKTFTHQPEYSEKEGIAKSFLVSRVKQTVTINALKMSFTFEENEKIATEVSRKYNDKILENICQNTGLEIKHKLLDSNVYFADYILEKTSV